MIRFDIKTGILYDDDRFVTTGYSGLDEWKNNPAGQMKKGLGPIPIGMYHIGKPYDSPNVGPFALPLEALRGTEVFGRGDFKIHGDSRIHPGSASHGCIILGRHEREWIANSGQQILEIFNSEVKDGLRPTME